MSWGKGDEGKWGQGEKGTRRQGDLARRGIESLRDSAIVTPDAIRGRKRAMENDHPMG